MLCHLFDSVFSHHDHPQGAHGGQRPFQRVDEVIVQVQEDQVRQVGQVGDLADEIVLVIQQPQATVTLEKVRRKTTRRIGREKTR